MFNIAVGASNGSPLPAWVFQRWIHNDRKNDDLDFLGARTDQLNPLFNKLAKRSPEKVQNDLIQELFQQGREQQRSNVEDKRVGAGRLNHIARFDKRTTEPQTDSPLFLQELSRLKYENPRLRKILLNWILDM